MVHYWPINNCRNLGGVDLIPDPNKAMAIAGIGDVNGDQFDDIVWTAPAHVTGELARTVFVLQIYNGQYTGIYALDKKKEPFHLIAGVGDINNDGVDDIVWRDQRVGSYNELRACPH